MCVYVCECVFVGAIVCLYIHTYFSHYKHYTLNSFKVDQHSVLNGLNNEESAIKC